MWMEREEISMHKVKIFSTTCGVADLETKINKWLDECHPRVAIIDIKYAISQCGNSGGSVYYCHSALIHYSGCEV